MKTTSRQNTSRVHKGAEDDLAMQVARMESFVSRTHSAFAAKVASSKGKTPVVGGAMAGAIKRVAK